MRRLSAILFAVLFPAVARAAIVGSTIVVDVAPTVGAACNTTEVRMVGTGANKGKYYCCDGTPTKAWVLCSPTGGGLGAPPGGSAASVQTNDGGGGFGAAPGFTANATTGAITTKILNGARIAAAYATGTGTSGDPYLGWAGAITAGAGRVQFASRPDGSTAYYGVPAAGITVPSNVDIVGDGNAVMTWGPSRNYGGAAVNPMLTVPAGNSYVVIEGLRFEPGITVPQCGLATTGGAEFIRVGTSGSTTAASYVTIRKNVFGIMRYSDGGDGCGVDDPVGLDVGLNGSSSFVSIVDNKLDSSASGIDSEPGHATLQLVVSNLEISRNTFNYTQQFTDFGFAIGLANGCVGSTLDGCPAVGTLHKAVTIANNTFRGINGGISISSPFEGFTVSDNLIQSDLIDACVSTSTPNVTTPYPKSNNAVITGNFCSNDYTPHNGTPCNSDSCGAVIGVSWVNGFLISDNDIYGTLGDGFASINVSLALNGTVAGNHVDQDGTTTSGSFGAECVRVFTGSNVIVSGNNCINPTGSAYRQDTNGVTQNGVQFIGNAVNDTNATASTYAGYTTTGTCNGCTMLGNTMKTLSAPAAGMMNGTPSTSNGNTGYVGSTLTYTPAFAGTLSGTYSSVEAAGSHAGGGTAGTTWYGGSEIVSEGVTGTTIEGYITFPDWTGTDSHYSFPNPGTSGSYIALVAGSTGAIATGDLPSGATLDSEIYTRTELNTSDGDAPNVGSNRMSWNNLVNVPAGFSDGTDDGGGGGSGDVVGPASATDNAIARFDTTTGKLLQNSGVSINDSGTVAIPSGQTLAVTSGCSVGTEVNCPASATSGGAVELPEDSDLGASKFVLTLGASDLTSDVTCTIDASGRIPDSCVGDGTDGGGGGDSFETMNAPAGTDPVADSSTDTLNWTATAPITVTGDSSTDTLTVAVSGATTGAVGVVQLAGDLAGTATSPSVVDDSHAHNSTTISGLDISADTNLAVSAPATLTDDTVGVQDASASQPGTVSTGAQTFAGLKTFANGIDLADPGDGNRGDEMIDNTTTCPDPASGNTTRCTKGGRPYVRDTGGPDISIKLDAPGEYNCGIPNWSASGGGIAVLDAYDIVACLDAAKAFAGNANTTADKGARVMLPEGTFDICTGPTTCPYALVGGMEIIGIPPRVQANDESTTCADRPIVATGGTWIDGGGYTSTVFSIQAQRGLTLRNIGGQNFGTFLRVGGDNANGLAFGVLDNLFLLGPVSKIVPTTQIIGLDLYNIQKVGLSNINVVYADTGINLINQSRTCQGADSRFENIYVVGRGCVSGSCPASGYPAVNIEVKAPVAGTGGSTQSLNWTDFDHMHIVNNTAGNPTDSSSLRVKGVSASANVNGLTISGLALEGTPDKTVWLSHTVKSRIEIASAGTSGTRLFYADSTALNNTLISNVDVLSSYNDGRSNEMRGRFNSLAGAYQNGLKWNVTNNDWELNADKATLTPEYLNKSGTSPFYAAILRPTTMTSNDTSGTPVFGGVYYDGTVKTNTSVAAKSENIGVWSNPRAEITSGDTSDNDTMSIIGVRSEPQMGLTRANAVPLFAAYTARTRFNLGSNWAATDASYFFAEDLSSSALPTGATMTRFTGLRIPDMHAVGTSNYSILVEAQTGADASKGNFRMDGAWNTGHIQFFTSRHIWNDYTNAVLRYKTSAPTSETDGRTLVMGTGSNSFGPSTWAAAGTSCTTACAGMGLTCVDGYPAVGGVAVGCASTAAVNNCLCK